MLVDRFAYFLSMLSVYGAAAFLVIVLPLFMWRDGRKGKSLGERVLFCILTQTSFWVNLVLLLGFLKICNRYTILVAFVLEYALIRWTISDRTFFVRWRGRLQMLAQTIQGRMTVFQLRLRIRSWFLEKRRKFFRRIFPHKPHLAQVVEGSCLAAILLYNALFLTHQVRIYHSFQFSDLPVHMSWIYGLTQGTLFVDGIYPFGMHAMCYLIQTLFPILPREVILYFGSFQTLLTIFTFYMFARLLFRWRYAPLFALMLWSILLNQGRYAASLPQESGVFALFAVGYFLLKMLRTQREAFPIRTDSKVRAFFRINQYCSRFYLQFDFFMLVLAVSLVIAFHFFTAIAAIVLSVSIVCCHLGRFLKKQYFVPIILAAVLGALIAVLPFGACYATGTPFQESMEWAMSVINGETWEGTGTGYLESLEETTDAPSDKAQAAAATTDTTEETAEAEQKVVSVFRRGLSPLQILRTITQAVYDFTTSAVLRAPLMKLVFLCALFVAIAGIPMLFMDRFRLYACGCYSVLLYAALLGLMGAAGNLGWVIILSSDRSAIFLEPGCFLIAAMAADMLFSLLSLWKNPVYQAVLSPASIGLSILCGLLLIQQGYAHHYFDVNLAYYNEADYLISRIRKERAPFSYTIISPTDEYYAIVDDGYHYELSELVHDVDTAHKVVKIPTPYIYVFLEKYTLQDNLHGRRFVSPEFARMNFQYRASTQDYYYQRNIIESKGYYWAKEMASLYPTRMNVYFENDIYIAYLLIQDENTPLDLNIDYISQWEG